jgi:cytoskeletal protein CcmA (bactofilin family)
MKWMGCRTSIRATHHIFIAEGDVLVEVTHVDDASCVAIDLHGRVVGDVGTQGIVR